MKTFITILILLISNSVFAGGSVGTMSIAQEALLKNTESFTNHGTGGGGVLRPQIIFNLGQQNGLVRYAHGQLVQGQWKVQEMALPVEVVVENSEFVNAMTESLVKNEWVELK